MNVPAHCECSLPEHGAVPAAAEEGILDIVVLGGDHIQVVGTGVFHTGPHNLQNLVTKTAVDASQENNEPVWIVLVWI